MRNGILCGMAVFSSIFACAADDTVEPVDLVGRNGAFTIKHKSGEIETVNGKQLQLPKEAGAITRGTVEPAADDSKKEKPASKPVLKKPAKPVEETPEEKAIRAADVEQLRQLRNQGGAYFYTEDDVPVPFDEVDERIATGKVEGLKVVGLHLQEWRPQTKAKASMKAETEPIEQAPAEPQAEPKKQY